MPDCLRTPPIRVPITDLQSDTLTALFVRLMLVSIHERRVKKKKKKKNY